MVLISSSSTVLHLGTLLLLMMLLLLLVLLFIITIIITKQIQITVRLLKKNAGTLYIALRGIVQMAETVVSKTICINMSSNKCWQTVPHPPGGDSECAVAIKQ